MYSRRRAGEQVPAVGRCSRSRSASLTADPDAPVPTRETVICRGGQHDGLKLSSLVGYPRLLVRDRVGPGHACDYVRTDVTNDGIAVFEHVAHEARHT